jgi:mxaJ protein
MLTRTSCAARATARLAIMAVLAAVIATACAPEDEERRATEDKGAVEEGKGTAEQRKQAEGKRVTEKAASAAAAGQEAGADRTEGEAARDAFRVCADPNNLPFSNRSEEGYENKIAELMAKDLGLPVEYYWLPQQMGFDRLTLKAWNEKEKRWQCDIVMGTTSLDVGTTTTPYYASTYTLVYPKGGKLGDLKSAQDLVQKARNKALRIGGFDIGPGAAWLQQNGLLAQLEPYQAQSGSRKVTPGRIVKDVADGKIDAALVWGPIAGYYAKQYKSANLEVLPLESPGIRFDYGISMGMRYGEDEWMQTIKRLMKENKQEIHAVLAQYNVPLVEIPKADLVREDDDD